MDIICLCFFLSYSGIIYVGKYTFLIIYHYRNNTVFTRLYRRRREDSHEADKEY